MATKEAATTPRKRNRKGEGSNLHKELIAAAMRLLDKAPGTQLSLRMVAKEAGVAAPSVYPHFTDANTLMNAILRECWDQMAMKMAEASATTNEGSVYENLYAQLHAYVDYAMERPSRYQLLFVMQETETEETLDLPGLIQPAFRKIRNALKNIEASGSSIPGPDSFSAALTILSLVHGRIALAHLAPKRPGNSRSGIRTFVTETLNLLLNANLKV